MAGQTVAGTAGQYAKGGRGAGKTAAYLVHRTVTTHGHDDVYTLPGGFFGYLTGVTGIFGVAAGVVIEALVKMLLYLLGYLRLLFRA